MKLSNRTLELLKNFSTVYKSVSIDPGNKIRTMAANKTIMAEAIVEDQFESAMRIYDLPRFLGVLSLFEDPEITLHDHHMDIKEDGRCVSYAFAEPSTIQVPPNKNIVLPDQYVQFDMTRKQHAEIIKALGVMSLPDFVVRGDGSNIVLTGTNVKQRGSDRYDITIGETDKSFQAVFKTENIKIIPGDYTVTISSQQISEFKAVDVTYWIAVESSSEFS